MASIPVRFGQAAARICSPIMHSIGAEQLLQKAEVFSAAVRGQGSGSGWDMENEIKAVNRFLPQEPSVVFDVGANNGRWSQLLTQIRKQPGDAFFLFECAPYCFPGLDQRISSIANPTLFKVAISNENGKSILNMPKRGSGLASLHARNDVSVTQEEYEQIEVTSRTVDDVVAETGTTRVDLLKMDIEGHEMFAIKGALGGIESGKVRSLMFEFGSANVNSRTFFRDVWDILRPFGYEFYRLLPGGAVNQVRQYGEELEYFRGATNYVATLVKPH